MINHVRTLLLNESAVSTLSVEGMWLVDHSFEKIAMSGPAFNLHEALFSGTSTIEDRVKRVDQFMPFLLDPEFSGYFRMFDDRITVLADVDRVKPGTVYDFYRTLRTPFSNRIDEIANSQYAPLVFQHADDVSTDNALDELYKIYAKGFESSKRLSACLYAVVLKYDLAYRKRGART